MPDSSSAGSSSSASAGASDSSGSKKKKKQQLPSTAEAEDLIDLTDFRRVMTLREYLMLIGLPHLCQLCNAVKCLKCLKMLVVAATVPGIDDVTNHEKRMWCVALCPKPSC